MATEKDLPVKENSFSEIDKVIAKEFGDLVDLSKVDTKVHTWFDTGVYALNYICSKSLFRGVPAGRVTSIDGLVGTGKSLLVANLMKDPKVDYILIVETEGGGNSAELMEFAGVDLKKVRIFKTNTFENYRIKKKDSKIEIINDNDFPKDKNKNTTEHIYHEGATRLIRRFINTIEFNNINKNILVVMDSLGNLTSVRDFSGTPDTGAKGKAVATFFRNFDVAFERTNIAFVFTNKLYTNIMNPYDPWKASGGVNVEYNPSLSIRLANTSEMDTISDKEMKNEKDRRKSALGSSIKTIRAQIKKSRFGTEFRQIPFIIDFSIGPAKYSGLFTLCRDFKIMTRSGNYYTINDVFEKSFMKKDFINLVRTNEKEVLEKIQKKLEQAEIKIRTEREELSTKIEETDEIEEYNEEDYSEMKTAMSRLVDK